MYFHVYMYFHMYMYIHTCTCIQCRADHVALLVFGREHLGHVFEAVTVGRLHASGRERHCNDPLCDVGQVKVKLLVHKPISTSGTHTYIVYIERNFEYARL